LPGQGMENFPRLLADFPEHHLPPSLRDEHNMVNLQLTGLPGF
jgi:hypothetical protein